MSSKRNLIIVMSICICCSFVAFQLGIFTLSKYRAIHVSLITDSPNYLLTQLLIYSTKQVEKSPSFDVNTMTISRQHFIYLRKEITFPQAFNCFLF